MQPQGVETELRQLLHGTGTLPVLFVGSGMSRRYLNAPTWEDLLRKFAAETSRGYAYYRGQAGGDLPMVARLIADEFYEKWFSEPKYKDSRDKYAEQVTNKAAPLKIEISNFLGGLQQLPDMEEELALFRRARVHALITTNWDKHLEDLFPNLATYVGQQDIIFAPTQGVGENYKIHGSIDDPNSLVLTANDYDAYWEKNPYLIAKLLTLFAEHTIIFLGYSLSDYHIQRLLGQLIGCLTDDQKQILNNRLIFVHWDPYADKPKLTAAPMTIHGHTVQIQELRLSCYAPLYRVLSSIPQKYSVQLLRQIKRDVYDLAIGSPSQARVHVIDITDNSKLDNVEVVIGVGTMSRLGEKGYSRYTRTDIFIDMLNGTRHEGGELITNRLIPGLFVQATYSPIFYPLHQAGKLTEEGSLKGDVPLPRKAKNLIDPKEDVLKPYSGSGKGRTFLQIQRDEPDRLLDLAVDCDYPSIEDIVALQVFLKEQIRPDEPLPTACAKLACRFDRLVYGGEYQGDKINLAEALGFEGLGGSPLPTRVSSE